MKPSDILPALRPFEVVPVGDEENEAFLLRDPQRYADRSIAVSRPVLFCLQHFDGRTQVATLSALWQEATDGHELPLAQLAEVVDEMDVVFLLDNERSVARGLELRAEFAAATVREHRFHGAESEIAAALAATYETANLPAAAEIRNETNDLAVLVAPHIDYVRGGPAWGLAYGLARRHFAGRTAVILGVNHQAHGEPLALTRKSFDSPFGLVETDLGLVDELAAALPFDAFADEFSFRDEHSVELAATALRYAFGDDCPRILPILCGSLEDFVQHQVEPARDPRLATFDAALRRLIDREADRLLVIASVDFAHLGPQFGATELLDENTVVRSLAADQRLLELVGRGDADAFFAALVDERNARNVCGIAPLYHALRCVDTDGTLAGTLHHWTAPEGYASVSFAAAGLKRKRALTPR